MSDTADTPQTARLLDCGWCYGEQGEEVHPHPECPIGAVVSVGAAASEASTAPLAASQPSEVPAAGEAAARPPTGRTGDPRRTLTPNEYSAAWHAVEGAAGEEGADPGTVLHAVLERLGIDTPPAEGATR